MAPGDWHHVVLVGGVFLVAGLVKGVIGMGLPAIAVGLLGSVMSPAQAAALLLVPSLVTNAWQGFAAPGAGALLWRLRAMLPLIVVGTLAGSGVIAGPLALLARPVLGGVLMLYAILALARFQPMVPARAERWAAPAVGLSTGLISGACGLWMMPSVPYIGALGLDRDRLVQALGISFTTSTVALAAGLALHGALPVRAVGGSVLALLPALVGMVAGGWVRGRVAPSTFRVVFFSAILLLGAELLWRGVV